MRNRNLLPGRAVRRRVSSRARRAGPLAFGAAVALGSGAPVPAAEPGGRTPERGDRTSERDDRQRLVVSRNASDTAGAAPVRSLDGSGNHLEDALRGAAGTAYRRLAPTSYADGVGAVAEGPNARYVSNRVFADRAQNLFSANGVTQWAWTWGQFVDHSIGLRAGTDEPLDTPFDATDPLELFTDEDGVLRATRSAAAEGSGATAPREQLNTVSSYLDAWAVYGGTEARLEWLREGPVDGDLSNNGARLLLTEDGHLPRATERGDAASAPAMERQGQLLGAPDADERQIVAGDVRANENIALTAVQTLFAREHNRVVDRLPTEWSERRKFDAARRLVIATIQHITYEEFLPALGVHLAPARGYRADVDASVSNEFATVGFRAHSMIHGEIELETAVDRYDRGRLALFRSLGIETAVEHDALELAVPLNVAFHRPQLVPALGVGEIALGLAAEAQYANDEQIDNQLRSVLFQLPSALSEDPDACLDGPALNECFALVSDLGVLDIVRARDHGIARYNDLRAAYGLARTGSFAALTGEASEDFPTDDPLVDAFAPIDDPDILDHVTLVDAEGRAVELDSEAADGEAVAGFRRTPLAARLKAIYGEVDRVDAFVGMVSEPHLPGSDLGELQHAMWVRQFEALRDGDRLFHLWDPALAELARRTGLTWRRSLAEVVVDNTGLDPDEVRPDLFLTED